MTRSSTGVSTSAPSSCSRLRMSSCPRMAAPCAGVCPLSRRHSRLAPCSCKQLSASTKPDCGANEATNGRVASWRRVRAGATGAACLGWLGCERASGRPEGEAMAAATLCGGGAHLARAVDCIDALAEGGLVDEVLLAVLEHVAHHAHVALTRSKVEKRDTPHVPGSGGAGGEGERLQSRRNRSVGAPKLLTIGRSRGGKGRGGRWQRWLVLLGLRDQGRG